MIKIANKNHFDYVMKLYSTISDNPIITLNSNHNKFINFLSDRIGNNLQSIMDVFEPEHPISYEDVNDVLNNKKLKKVRRLTNDYIFTISMIINSYDEKMDYSKENKN